MSHAWASVVVTHVWTHPYIKFVICALFCCVSRTLIIWCALAARRIASRSLEDPEATAFLWAHEADDLASCGRRTLRALRTRAGKREDKMRPSGPFRGNYCTMRYHVSHARRANRRSILQCKKKRPGDFQVTNGVVTGQGARTGAFTLTRRVQVSGAWRSAKKKI